MKSVLLSLCFLLPYAMAFSQSHPVNLLAGDRSFERQFQRLPDSSDAEFVRLQTHLRYVEAQLRTRPSCHLSPIQIKNRTEALQLLAEYHQAGVFPKNQKYPGRRPCFVDNEGNDCAVAHLVRQTWGNALVEEINQAHQYDYIQDIQSDKLLSWAQEYGFEPQELALIQPNYEYEKRQYRRLKNQRRKAKRHAKKRRYPVYRCGGLGGLAIHFQDFFTVPVGLKYDEQVFLNLVLSGKGEVKQVQLNTDLNRQPALVALEDSLIKFAKSLIFTRPRWQRPGHKHDGFVDISLIFKVSGKDCHIADTFHISAPQLKYPPDEEPQTLIQGKITDSETGMGLSRVDLASHAYPGTPGAQPGTFRPVLKMLGSTNPDGTYQISLDPDTHYPSTNLRIVNSPNHREVFVPDVPYGIQTLDLELEPCIPISKPGFSSREGDPSQVLIVIFKQ